MNQKSFEQIINAGQPVDITPELMAAARESANRARTVAIRSGMQWMRDKWVRLIFTSGLTTRGLTLAAGS